MTCDVPGDGMDDSADRGPSHEELVTVLVVDDQASFRRALRELVAATEGFELVGDAPSGEEALKTVDALVPRMVIMDKRMPGIRGGRGHTVAHRPASAPRRLVGFARAAGSQGDDVLRRLGIHQQARPVKARIA